MSEKRAQNNKNNIHKNRQRVDQSYKTGDNVMLNDNTSYKYETTHTGLFVITRCCTNGTVSLENCCDKN